MAQTSEQLLSPSSYERIYRRNFRYFLADNILFTVALGIISATTVIPDFVRHLTDSEILIGLSGNLFTVGFTLPQLFVARYIVRHERKKWWFIGPNIPIRFVILIFGVLTMLLGRDYPHLILAAFFFCYGIAGLGDGLVGVPWADMVGTSLDSRWRARMLGFTVAGTGVIMLLIAPLIGLVLSDKGPGFPNNYGILFGASGALFALSIPVGLFFHELPGGKAAESVPTLREFLPDLGRVLRDDVPFRSFIIVRVFTSLYLMSAPFYIGYATVDLGLSSEVAVPALLAMQTIGSVAGALGYTWLGARNNILALRLILSGAALSPLCALLAGVVGPGPLYVGFLVAGLTTSTLLASFLNWVVSYANPDQRPIYVGLANTVVAVVSFIAPFIAGTIAQTFGYRLLFAVSLAMVLIALSFAVRFLRSAPISAAQHANP